MSTDKKAITLQPYSVGDLLTEVTRAYLHGGNPSVMVRRVTEGVIKFITEKELAVPGAEAGDRMDPTERLILSQLRYQLERVYDELKKLEEHHYSM